MSWGLLVKLGFQEMTRVLAFQLQKAQVAFDLTKDACLLWLAKHTRKLCFLQWSLFY